MVSVGEMVPGSSGRVGLVVVDPAPRPSRRSFPVAYRERVVAEYRSAPHGEKGAVLRREGLYQSQLREWAAAFDARVAGLPGPVVSHRRKGGDAAEVARLRRENERLSGQLRRAEAAVVIMGKLQVLLEAVSGSTGTGTLSLTS